jgi:hypothetical protein
LIDETMQEQENDITNMEEEGSIIEEQTRDEDMKGQEGNDEGAMMDVGDIFGYWKDNNAKTELPKWRVHKQGGGDRPESIPSEEEALIRFYRKNRLTATAMDELLKLLHFEFRLPFIPSSVFKLKKAEERRFPPFTQYSFKDPTTKMNLPTLDFLDICKRMLSDPTLLSQMVFDYQGSNSIKHPSNSVGWYQYSIFRSLMDHHRQQQHLLLTPTFFVDEYKQLSHRNRKVLGIYFTLANLPKEILDSPRHKYLLCLVPPEADLNKVIQRVIVRGCRQLETGLDWDINGQKISVRLLLLISCSFFLNL